MKISAVKVFLTDDNRPSVYVKIETDEGIVGYGESTIGFMPRGAYGLLQDITPYLIGEDPERIEYLWQMAHRVLFYRGGPDTGAALSGIDMALWDIKGKKYGVPVYQLLGGRARDRVLVYGHAGGMDAKELVENAKERVSRGVRFIRYRGFHDHDANAFHDHQTAVEQSCSYMAALREALGDDVEFILECHGRFDPRWAIELAQKVEKYRPYYIEDPIRHENPAVLGEIKAKINIPIATGERYHDKWDFDEIINKRLVDYVRPDIAHCGGITEMRKIAAMAEVQHIKVVPHNNSGPLGTAATMHASLAIPNIELAEAPFVNKAEHSYKVTRPFPVYENGFADLPEKPGLGVEFDEDAAVDREPNYVTLPKLKGKDGSVQDY